MHPSSVLSILEAARDPASAGRIALIAGGAHYRFADLAPRVERLVTRLLALGMGPGSRAALVADSRIETVLAVHALLELGAALVPIHPRLTPPEVTALLADGSADTVLSPDLLADLDNPTAPASSPLLSAPADPHALAAIVHTSGTTGRPKGAMLPRSAFLASAEASARNLGWHPLDRWLLCMPLAHVGGLSILTRCLVARAPVILEPRFEPRAILDAIRRERATILSVVPTMLRALLDEDRDGSLALLRVVLLGGAATPLSLLEECARRDVPALTSYGLTETCSQIVAQSPRAPGTNTVEPGSGRALQGVTLRIATDHGGPAAEDEVGRIQVRGPMLMRGYWPAGAAAPSPEAAPAWFDTGDLGALDSHARLHVHARRTDLIVTGGENVYPVEVEQALEALPGVLRALVFGVPDDRWGQIVAAALVLDPARPPAEPALFAALAGRLAPHKRPRRYCVANALPLTPSGKLDRAAGIRRFTPDLRPVSAPRA